MKKTILSVVIVLLISANAYAVENQLAEAPKEADGNAWVKWGATEKNNFLEGFMVGSFYMIKENFTPAPKLSEEGLAEMAARIDSERDRPAFTGAEVSGWSELEKAYLIKNKNNRLMNYMIRGISKTEIAEGLDALYSDGANRHISIADAVYLVRKKIARAPQQDLENILQYLREGKKNPKYLKVENDSGELVRYIQFP